MPKKLPLHVYRQRARNRWVTYYRVGHGKRIRLPDNPDTPEFKAAYHACLVGQTLPGRPIAKPSAGSVKALLVDYMATKRWQDEVKASTKRARVYVYNQIIAKIGDERIEDLDKANVVRAMEKRGGHSANNFLKAVRPFFKWAKELGKIEVDPTEGVQTIALAKPEEGEEEGHHTWTDAELAAFEKAYLLGTRERVAYAIMAWQGLRVGDAHRVGWQHVKDGTTIAIKTEKKGVMVYLPILPELAAALKAGPVGDMQWIIGASGVPMAKKESFAKWFNNACRKIGLKDCTCHGLRKAAATRYADRGATERQLMAWFGWTDPRMAARYTRAAEVRRLASQMAATVMQPAQVFSLTQNQREGLQASSL
jgi:integrase